MKAIPFSGLLLVLAGCGPPAQRVRINLPLPPKLDLTDYSFLYFPGFITNVENETFDTEREAINYLKREISRKGIMGVIGAPPADLSGKDSRAFFTKKQPYFRSFNFEHAQDTLAVTGEIGFEVVDRSGFREVERIDLTGRRFRQTQFVEITGFNLDMRVYVYNLSEGNLLYSQLLRDTTDVEGSNPDQKLVFYDLMERISQRVLGLFSNTLVKAERSLL